MVGTEETRPVVLRGNSASGKSSVAAGLRERFGRGLALVSQDNLRRIVLRERDLCFARQYATLRKVVGHGSALDNPCPFQIGQLPAA